MSPPASLLVVAATAMFAAVAAPAASAVEEPKFARVLKDGDFEVRDYAPQIVASVDTRGEAVDARNSGFMPLANYIFAKERPGEKIAMTAPVVQAPRAKIAMTAPVTQTASAGDEWRVSFIMPSSWTMETLPSPENPAVELAERPARRMAVVRYSWFAGPDKMARKEAELLAWVSAQGLTPVGEPEHAFYDPPWTPPFARRNEVMVEIAADAS
ncbi:heme-binding protein [bacterium]|nr:heme-binding protein [bacterium]